MPMFVCPHTFIHPSYVHMPKGCTPPYAPHSLCICMFSEALHVMGGCNGLPFVLGHFPYTTPVWGASPSLAPPKSVVGFPVHQYVSGI